MRTVAFGATFLGAWLALDRLATAPPRVTSALLALTVAAAVIVAGSALLLRWPLRRLPDLVGLRRPATTRRPSRSSS